MKEAEARSEEDKKKRETVEIRNEADSMIYAVEKNLTELGDKVEISEKNTIREKIAETKTAIEGDNPSAIRTALDELTKVSHKLAEEMYKQSSAQAGPQGPESQTDESSAGRETDSQGGAQQDQSTVDAEFEEADKKNTNNSETRT